MTTSIDNTVFQYQGNPLCPIRPSFYFQTGYRITFRSLLRVLQPIPDYSNTLIICLCAKNMSNRKRVILFAEYFRGHIRLFCNGICFYAKKLLLKMALLPKQCPMWLMTLEIWPVHQHMWPVHRHVWPVDWAIWPVTQTTWPVSLAMLLKHSMMWPVPILMWPAYLTMFLIHCTLWPVSSAQRSIKFELYLLPSTASLAQHFVNEMTPALRKRVYY